MGTPTGASAQLDTYLSANKKLVNKKLLQLLAQSGGYKRFESLDKSFSHTVLLHGKRLRPIMAVMTYELMGGSDKKAILNLACAIELIHAGSLMLDDLPAMDNAEYRRGKKTNHALFGDAVTILASAGLWVEAFRIVASADTPDTKQLVDATSDCIGKDGLVLGQYMDLYAFNKKQSLHDLRLCYELKTGTLFQLAMTYGAVLAGATKQERKQLESFGKTFGLAYQIRDDIIDATAAESETGKDAHKDEENNKPNYVSLLGIEGAKKVYLKEVTSAKQVLRSIKKDTNRFEQLLDALSLD